MWINLIVIVICFVIFERASNYLVEGLGVISRKFIISEAVLGASIAAIGSSAPEFGSSAFSVIEGHPTIGLGTIIGSAIFNITVIVGAVALFGKYKLSKRVFYRDGLFYLLTVVIAVIGVADGNISRIEAILWTLTFLGYLGWLVYDARRGKPVPKEAVRMISMRRAAAYVIGGLIFIALGAWLLVHSVISLAAEAGISEALFSLIVVAVGTSVPDLITSAQAARKGMSSLAVSNAIGSNIFDILACLGIPLSFRATTSVQDVAGISIIYLLVSLLLALLVIRVGWELSRRDAGLLFGAYGFYLGLILLL
jgi:cation:H+ antiporter